MDAPSYEQLVLENQHLRKENARLEQTIRELQKRLEDLERTAKRQAAPFSKGEPKKKPKKPGRKSGEPTRQTRPPPTAAPRSGR